MEKESVGRVLMDKYQVGRLLGKGTFAKVYYARNVTTSQSVAIKVIDKEKVLKVGMMDQIKREISVMRIVRHPNVVQLYEVMATKSKIYFVLEYVKGGELFGKIAKGRLREDAARRYFQQLISAVGFCHSKGVYHRDLKPENLLLDSDGNLKVSDFGLSALAESTHKDGLLHTTCGTPAYVAPEVISRKGYEGTKADIWSCGVILFVLMAGYLPFQCPNLMDMYRKISRADFKCPHWFPSDVQRLLLRILDPNPSTRVAISVILEHPWVKKGFNNKLFKNKSKKGIDGTDGGAVAAEQGTGKLSVPNAFDIISLSARFDLSGLFEEPAYGREATFTSVPPPTDIISKLEEAARGSHLKVKN